MRLALFEPDQPGNTGTLIRFAACMDIAVDVIEPCGFPFSRAALRRAGLDYLNHAQLAHHTSFDAFMAARSGRLVLVTTRAEHAYTDFAYRADDTILMGRESAGVPDAVHDRADARVRIPMAAGMRSLNVALAAAMVTGEALRQTSGRVSGEDH
jgi:tRNA (cytidine/uridine-2'-O-)-methyltransferase